MLKLMIFLLLCLSVPISAQQSSSQPVIQSRAAIVVDGETGRVLWAKNVHDRRSPASLTKMLSALLVLKNSGGQELVTVSRQASRMTGSSVGLLPDERVSVQNMLLGMFYRSGNDAAVALAEHVGGSVEGFARLMNAKAQSVGMTNSRFANPHGLDEAKHYSTAYDLALLTRVVLQNPSFAQMARGNYVKVRWGDEMRDLWNINSFLWRYNGATGVKTGYTSRAGYCLAASTQQGNTTLILVLLGAQTSNQRWNDAIRVLDYAFANYQVLKDEGMPAIASPSEDGVHVVEAGETLWDIAQLYDCSINTIVEINGLRDPNLIRSGQALQVP